MLRKKQEATFQALNSLTIKSIDLSNCWHNSIVSGIFIVLLYRLFEFLFSGVLSSSSTPKGQQGQGNKPSQQQQQQQHQIKQSELLEDLKAKGLSDSPPPIAQEPGWMNEAKDWAGELISGQTTTGRILVRDTEKITFSLLEAFYSLTPTSISGCVSVSFIDRLIGYLFHRCLEVSVHLVRGSEDSTRTRCVVLVKTNRDFLFFPVLSLTSTLSLHPLQILPPSILLIYTCFRTGLPGVG